MTTDLELVKKGNTKPALGGAAVGAGVTTLLFALGPFFTLLSLFGVGAVILWWVLLK